MVPKKIRALTPRQPPVKTPVDEIPFEDAVEDVLAADILETHDDVLDD